MYILASVKSTETYYSLTFLTIFLCIDFNFRVWNLMRLMIITQLFVLSCFAYSKCYRMPILNNVLPRVQFFTIMITVITVTCHYKYNILILASYCSCSLDASSNFLPCGWICSSESISKHFN